MAWYDQFTSGHVEDTAKALAGNWRHFESFGWSSDAQPDDADQCAIFYLSNRDSGILDASNEACILEALKPYTGWMRDPIDGHTFDVETCSHGHWAVGHVDGIVIRVYRDGEITEAFRELHGLACALSDYPVLDDSDLSDREYEAENEAWGQAYGGARNFRKALTALAPWHEALFNVMTDDRLYTIWRAICEKREGGSTCEHSVEGVYFPIDRVFEGRGAMTWPEVRTLILDLRADEGPTRLARKFDAARRESSEPATVEEKGE